ncbi:MAG: DNA polymerase III subunit beta [Candidatus Reconcilbacillus cellulovorans]|uniref:Beta sliding clamp n=1 Tax=Candidatus Reconcilbacillus cellulovorans TaxID=1906605 RepID=A0A2A6E0S3_9BACL|nr:MAG: DNA polymerase III subunit beta [Candidatus Reconcilbacillus cellulovorans]
MKFVVLREHLRAAIQQVSAAVSSRPPVPVLGGICIEAGPSGLTLAASDTDVSIQSSVPLEENGEIVVSVERPGRVVLPAKLLTDLVRKMPADSVEFESSEGFHAVIRSGTSTVQLVGYDPDDFPDLPSPEEGRRIVLSSEQLRQMIRQTSFAASRHDSTPVLTGVLWDVGRDRIRLVACDRHRLAWSEAKVENSFEKNENFVILWKTMDELEKLLEGSPSFVDVVFTESRVSFKFRSVSFHTRVLEGTYPDTSKLVPETFRSELVMDVALLIDSIDRASVLTREEKTNIVRLALMEEDAVEVSASSAEVGKMSETLPVVSLTGERIKVSFNSRYMLEALKAIGGERVHIGFSGPAAPIVMRPEGGGDVLQLVLPYRTVQ